MHVILKCSNGKIILYELDDNDNIDTIKKKIYEKENILPDSQKILISDKELNKYLNLSKL
jgi:hypothetical protein